MLSHPAEGALRHSMLITTRRENFCDLYNVMLLCSTHIFLGQSFPLCLTGRQRQQWVCSIIKEALACERQLWVPVHFGILKMLDALCGAWRCVQNLCWRETLTRNSRETRSIRRLNNPRWSRPNERVETAAEGRHTSCRWLCLRSDGGELPAGESVKME